MSELVWSRNPLTPSAASQQRKSGLWRADAANLDLDCGRRIMQFLDSHPKTLITAEGLAAETGHSVASVQMALCSLEKSGQVHRRETAGMVFFGLARPTGAHN